MNGGYLGIVVLMAVAAALAGVLVSICWLLGPKKNTRYKSAPYECGVAPIGDARERFPIKFYLVAILFIIFDIEAVFLWGFYTAYKNSPDNQFVVFAFFEFLAYMSTWILGYVYAIRVGAIDWDETTTLAPEKFGRPETQAQRNGELRDGELELVNPVTPEPILVPVAGGAN